MSLFEIVDGLFNSIRRGTSALDEDDNTRIDNSFYFLENLATNLLSMVNGVLILSLLLASVAFLLSTKTEVGKLLQSMVRILMAFFILAFFLNILFTYIPEEKAPTITISSPENCSNKVDDDGNGYIDCCDLACWIEIGLGGPGPTSSCIGYRNFSNSLSHGIVNINGATQIEFSNAYNGDCYPEEIISTPVIDEVQNICQSPADTYESNCTDNIDNDCDGNTDCDNLNCWVPVQVGPSGIDLVRCKDEIK